jgi:hypothetical protein
MSATIEWTDASGAVLSVELDATPTQSWESTAEATEHPVETGSAVTDHVRPGNDTITIEGVITNTPVIVPAGQLQGATRAPGTIDLPGVGAVSVLKWSGAFDRVAECRELLRSLVKAGLPATLATGRTAYRLDDTLVLVRFRVDRDATTGDSINVSLDFKQLRVVSTQRVAVPAVRRLIVPQARGTTPATPAGSAAYNYVHSGG